MVRMRQVLAGESSEIFPGACPAARARTISHGVLVDDQTRANFCYSQLLRPILRRSLGTRGVRLDSFVLGITYFLEIAFDTFRIARLTNAPSVPDQLMGEENPLVPWNRGHQIQLNLLRLSVLG